MPCESSSDVDMCIKACQMFCLYDAKCNIFSYSVSKQLCTLIQETSFMNYLAGCDVLSGPGHPLIEECAIDHPEEQCERFIGQDCIYTGNQVLNKTNVENPVDCQTLLDAQGGLLTRAHVAELLTLMSRTKGVARKATILVALRRSFKTKLLEYLDPGFAGGGINVQGTNAWPKKGT